MARNYSNVAVATALASSITSSDATITVGSNAGYPSPPFTVLIDPGTPSEEVCEVTSVAGTTWTISRGVDGTPATSHASGAVVEHGVSARDWREPNDHVSATTNVHGIAATSALVTLTGSQTLTNKTLTAPTIGSATLTSPSVSGGTFTGATLVTPTIGSFVNAQHSHTDAASGGAVGSSGLFYFPTPVTSADTFNGTGALSNVTGMAITYTAPASWPVGAQRILYTAVFESDCDNLFQVDFTSDDASIMPRTARFHNDDTSDINTYQLSWPGPLTAAGSHTARMRAHLTSPDILLLRSFWLTLI